MNLSCCLALMLCLLPVAAQHLRGAVFVPWPWQPSVSLQSVSNSNMEMHVFENTSNGEETKRNEIMLRVVEPQLDMEHMNALTQAVQEIGIEDGVVFEASEPALQPPPTLFMSSARQANQAPCWILVAAASGVITLSLSSLRLCVGWF